MKPVLVDSNVLLDIATEDPVWYQWSASALEAAASEATLVLNPLVYAEVSVAFSKIESLESALSFAGLRRDPLPFEAAFLAGKAFMQYRKRGGKRHAPLPDFYIGAHAAVSRFRLLTRDAARYRTYFPTLEIIAPRPDTRAGARL